MANRACLTALSLVALLALTSCTRSCDRHARGDEDGGSDRVTRGASDDERNSTPFAPYTRLIIRSNAAIATVTTCKMFGGTRVGYCLVEATPDGMRDLFDKVGFAEDLPEGGPHDAITYGETSCLALPGFGTPSGPGHAPLPGTTRHRATKPLPHNTNNIKFRRVYLAPSTVQACFEYEFPYG
jgi:hypothetical protein